MVRKANQFDYLVIIVTNQAGIARGYYSEFDFSVLMDWVKGKFISNGAYIDGVYYCPHHPVHGIGVYGIGCECRKPRAGMLIKAAEDFNINLGKSIIVGDSQTDMDAGLLGGVGKLILIGDHERLSNNFEVAGRVSDVSEICGWK